MRRAALIAGAVVVAAGTAIAVAGGPPPKGRAPADRVARPAFAINHAAVEIPQVLAFRWGCDRAGSFATRLVAARRVPTLAVRVRPPGGPERSVRVPAGRSYQTAAHGAGTESWKISVVASPATRTIAVSITYELRRASASCNLKRLTLNQATESHAAG